MNIMTRYFVHIFFVGLTIGVMAMAIFSTNVLSSADNGGIQKNTKETNVFNFVRLVVLRLIYGFATMMGFKENISEFADGALVPPGEDDYGLGDYDRSYLDVDYR